MKYLLDTNVVIDFIRNNNSIKNKILQKGINNCCICDITLWELYYGAYKSNDPDYQSSIIDMIADRFEVVNLSDYVKEASRQKAKLEKEGKKLEDYDILIGSSAIALNYILVTNNTKHLSRLENVKFENWRD